MTITFRKANTADYEWLLSLREMTMDPHIAASGITPTLDKHEAAVKRDFEAAQIVVQQGTDIGMLKLLRTKPIWKLSQIQIVPEHQGKGIGEQILRRVLADAAQHVDTVALSVLKANPARALYERLGFIIVESSGKAYYMEVKVMEVKVNED